MEAIRYHQPWTKEEDAFLRHCITEKMSAGQIAKVMPGRSRNAIMGHVFREKIKLHNTRPDSVKLKLKGIKKPLRKKPERIPFKESIYIESNVFSSPTPNMVKLYDLKSGQCVCPIHQGHLIMFCGSDVLEGYPYCQEHKNIFYRKSRRLHAEN